MFGGGFGQKPRSGGVDAVPPRVLPSRCDPLCVGAGGGRSAGGPDIHQWPAAHRHRRRVGGVLWLPGRAEEGQTQGHSHGTATVARLGGGVGPRRGRFSAIPFSCDLRSPPACVRPGWPLRCCACRCGSTGTVQVNRRAMPRVRAASVRCPSIARCFYVAVRPPARPRVCVRARSDVR